LDFEANIRDFNKQFGDQQRILDIRNENKVALITDIQEFFKRRSELDLDYGKNLDRICERFQERLAKQRALYGFQKKDRASYVNLWSKLLIDTRFKAKTATTLSEIYSKNIVTRLTEITEDIQRIARSVKDTHLLLEVEIKKQINVLQTDMRKYYMRHNDYTISKNKFDVTDDNMKKAEESPLKKGSEKRLKQLEKALEKKRSRLHECQENSIHSRNEYILSLDSVLSILNKYYHHDLSDIVMKYDHNFHNSVSATLQTFIGAEVRMATAQVQATDSLAHSVKTMDAENDIKMFLEDNQASFIPDMNKFSYIPAIHDEIHTITADECIEQELNTKQKQLNSQITTLQVELSDLQGQIEKRIGGLEATYKKYDAEMNGFYHIDMTLSGQTPTSSTLTSNPPQQLKLDKEEWENGLLNKFKEKIMSENLLHQKQAKFDALTKALGEIASDTTRHSNIIFGSKRSVKLFGTSLKYQLEETGREIPDLVESCAKYIARFGLKHQGIFRVPGAAQEIADMKVAFEEGRDPLSGLNHWKDINAVAGVFRAYFRELGEPLFPYTCNPDYLRVTSITKLDEQIAESKAVLNKIPDWNVQVIKYMLKFLNLIGQFSDHNKMTSHNLAVVFGPTLFRVADNENLLTKQGQINVFVELLISHFYDIFPNEPREGHFQTLDREESGEEDTDPDDHDHDCTEEEMSETEAEADYTTEAIALHDFTARSNKEISFHKGDKIKIYTKTTPDWWDAKVDGKYGYVPVSYIKIIGNTSASSIRHAMTVSGANDSHPNDEEKKEWKKDNEPFDPLDQLDGGICSTNHPSSTDLEEGFSDDDGEHCGNVFAAIDPTCSPENAVSTKKVVPERSSYGGLQSNSPTRPRKNRFELKAGTALRSNNDPDVSEEESSASQPPMHLASKSTPTNTTNITAHTYPPPTGHGAKSATNPMFVVSKQDLFANKLRSTSETLHEDQKSDDHRTSPQVLSEMDLSRDRPLSVKDKSKAFSKNASTLSSLGPDLSGIADRPQSQILPPVLGHMRIESADRLAPAPNFKPPPPPALKPKPSARKKENGSQNSVNSKEDNTRL